MADLKKIYYIPIGIPACTFFNGKILITGRWTRIFIRKKNFSKKKKNIHIYILVLGNLYREWEFLCRRYCVSDTNKKKNKNQRFSWNKKNTQIHVLYKYIPPTYSMCDVYFRVYRPNSSVPYTVWFIFNGTYRPIWSSDFDRFSGRSEI